MQDTSRTLYDCVADTRAEKIWEWERGIGLPGMLTKEPASLQEWKESFCAPIKMEVGHSLLAAMEEAEHPMYEGFLSEDESGKWKFDHFWKLKSRRDMSGMVVSIDVGNGSFEWLGVFHDMECLTLNKAMIFEGWTNLHVTVKLLTSIQSSARQYTACETEAAIAFEEQLLGRARQGPRGALSTSVPTVALRKNSENLNSDQADAVRCWVGSAATPPPSFMLLQGPPGTGKTTTAVELLRECLGRKRSTKQKYICAGPSWTSVYEYLRRFVGTHHHYCESEKLRIAMSGCNDAARSAAEEPKEIEKVSVVALLRSIEAWVGSADRLEETYHVIMGNIRTRAPVFHDGFKTRVRGKSVHYKACELNDCKDDLREALIREADVVFSTLNALGSAYISKALDRAHIGMLIVDEAGQAPDPDLFIGCNLRPDRLLLIGDHKQLPPFVKSPCAGKHGLNISSLERLYPLEHVHKRMLTLQYRMPPAVLAWPNKEFYNGQLQCADVVLQNAPSSQYSVHDVAFGEQSRVGTTFTNPSEAACAVQCIRNIRGADPTSSVLVITPYKGQRHLMQKYVNVYLPNDKNVRVSTIDSCQGAECAHVILSLVRTDESIQRDCFAIEPKHLCVALTRARKSMAVVCNAVKMRQNARMASLLTDAVDRGCLSVVPKPVVVSGQVVGKHLVSFEGAVLPTDLSALGWKVLHGDEVKLRYMRGRVPGEDEDELVVDVAVEVGSELRSKAFPYQLVNDRNVCFEVNHSEQRALLDALRRIANQAEKNTCNSSEIVVCERQPTDDRYFTVTMGDVLLAEQIMNGDIEVWITTLDYEGERVTRKALPYVARELFYHKYVPFDSQLPLVHVPVTSDHCQDHRLTYMVRLVEDGDDVWSGIIEGKFCQPSVRTLHGMLRDPEELVLLVLVGYFLRESRGLGRADADIKKGIHSLSRLYKDVRLSSSDVGSVVNTLRRELQIDLDGRTLGELCRDSTCTGGLLLLAETTVTKEVLDAALRSFDHADLPRQDYEDAAIVMCVYEGWWDSERAAWARGLTSDQVAQALRRVVPFLPSFAGRRCRTLLPRAAISLKTPPSPYIFTLDRKGTLVFDDALSCRTDGSGWVVTQYFADPQPSLDRVPVAERAALLADLRTRARDTHMLGYTGRLMPQWVLDDASLAAGSGQKHVLEVTYRVGEDGVAKVSMQRTVVEVARNFEAAEKGTWQQLKKRAKRDSTEAYDAVRNLQAAVLAMMSQERYFEEATQIQNLHEGPRHMLQYLVVRAKRVAAKRLSKNGPRLYTNYSASAAVAEALQMEHGHTETALCHELQRLRQADQRSHGAAIARRVADLTQCCAREYRAGSSVSFTSPLRNFADYEALQALLRPRGAAKDTTKTLDQHNLEMWVNRKRDGDQECTRAESVRKAHYPILEARVTGINTTTGEVRVYIPESGAVPAAVVPSTLTHLGDNITLGSTVRTKLVLANPGAFGRHRPHYIVPYGGMPSCPEGADDPSPRSNTNRKGNKCVAVRFAFTDDDVKRTMEEVSSAVFEQLSAEEDCGRTKDCVFVKRDMYAEDGWILMPKSRLCSVYEKSGKRCTEQLCSYRHLFTSEEDLLVFFKASRHLFVRVARTVSDKLRCTVRTYSAPVCEP